MKSKELQIEQGILTIEDDLPSRLGLLRFLFLLYLLIEIMKLIDGLLNGFSLLDYIVFIATGSCAILFFFYFLRKETSKSTINLELVSHLEERRQLFQKQCILKLTNGKCRQLPTIKTHQHFEELQEAIKQEKNTINTDRTHL